MRACSCKFVGWVLWTRRKLNACKEKECWFVLYRVGEREVYAYVKYIMCEVGHVGGYRCVRVHVLYVVCM